MLSYNYLHTRQKTTLLSKHTNTHTHTHTHTHKHKHTHTHTIPKQSCLFVSYLKNVFSLKIFAHVLSFPVKINVLFNLLCILIFTFGGIFTFGARSPAILKHRFPTPSIKALPEGALFTRVAVHRRCQRAPKVLVL